MMNEKQTPAQRVRLVAYGARMNGDFLDKIADQLEAEQHPMAVQEARSALLDCLPFMGRAMQAVKFAVAKTSRPDPELEVLRTANHALRKHLKWTIGHMFANHEQFPCCKLEDNGWHSINCPYRLAKEALDEASCPIPAEPLSDPTP